MDKAPDYIEVVNALPDILPLDIKYIIWRYHTEHWLEDSAPPGLKEDLFKNKRSVWNIQYPIVPQK